MVHVFFQALPANLRHLAGIGLALVFALGVMLWFTGVRTARALACVAAAGGGAAMGWTFLPGMAGVSPLTAAGIGGVAGLIVGLVSFRFTQAAIVGTGIGIGAGVTYYVAYVTPPAGAPAIGGNLPADPSAAVGALWENLTAHFHALEGADQEKLLVLTLGVGVIAFVLAMGFSRLATLLMSAVGGAALIVLCGQLFQELYGTQSPWPEKLSSKFMIWGILAIVGIALQWRFFARKADKSSKMRHAGAGAALTPV